MRRTNERRTPEAHTRARESSPTEASGGCDSCGCRCAPRSHGSLDVAYRRARLSAVRDPHAGDLRGRLHFALRLVAGLLILWARRVAPGVGLLAVREAAPGILAPAAVLLKLGAKALWGAKALLGIGSGLGVALLAGFAVLRRVRARRAA